MTAPGQEPDEVTTAKPPEDDSTTAEPDLGAIGDNHMPDDLRRLERESAPGPEGTSEEAKDTPQQDGAEAADEGRTPF